VGVLHGQLQLAWRRTCADARPFFRVGRIHLRRATVLSCLLPRRAAHQSALVYGGGEPSGEFKIRQRRGGGALTSIVLQGGDFRSCSKSSRPKSRSYRAGTRGAWTGTKSGRFASVGRFSRGSAAGGGRSKGRTARSSHSLGRAVWLTEDRCDGTLTRVRKGKVQVFDVRRKRHRDRQSGEQLPGQEDRGRH
jgi:hypothetical protein